MTRCRFSLSILLIILMPLPAAAANPCVKISFHEDTDHLRWNTKAIQLPIRNAAGWFTADFDGDGVSELIVRQSDGTMLTVSKMLEPPLQVRTVFPPGGPSTGELTRAKLPGENADRMVRITPESLTVGAMNPYEASQHGERRFSLHVYPPYFAPAKLLSWQCVAPPFISWGVHVITADGTDIAACYRFGPNVATPVLEEDVIDAQPDSHFEGMADLDGDGFSGPIVASRKYNRWSRHEGAWHLRPWVALPDEFRRRAVFLGDFTGDGQTDLLLVADPFKTTMVAVSHTDYALQLPAPWPLPSTENFENILVADFNGDGTDDLVFLTPSADALTVTIALSERSAPAPSEGTLLLFRGEELLSLLSPAGWLSTVEDLRTGTLPDEVALCGVSEGIHRVVYLPAGGTPQRRTVELSLRRTPERGFRSSSTVSPPPDDGGIHDYDGPPTRPSVCIGYNPRLNNHMLRQWGAPQLICPRGYGYFAASEGATKKLDYNYIEGVCCPLPAADIVTETTVIEREVCPDGFIAVGAFPRVADSPASTTSILCAQINLSRYELGPIFPGRYWGNGLSSRGQNEQLQLFDLPLAIRYGISRTDYSLWTLDGCVGTPVGALLVSKPGKYCFQSSYRQLLYRGMPGDPPAGTPVQMYPDCKELGTPYEPMSGCTLSTPNQSSVTGR